MELGMIGLGRMGANMARRLMGGGHEVVVFDRDQARVGELQGEGATGAVSPEDVAAKLSRPRVLWVMVPAGEATEQVVEALQSCLDRGDMVIDGGNSHYKDDVRRASALGSKGIQYVDVGTSGGVWGIARGYCLMIGGPEAAVKHLDPIFRTLAPGRGETPSTPGRSDDDSADLGYLHCGPTGAGHFVKMVHNGIEYGLMQAYAEGFDIMRGAGSPDRPSELRYALDLGAIAELWRRGSVVGSWLLDLTAAALTEDPSLSRYEGVVEDSGEGRWAVMTAIEEAVSADVLSASLYARFRSRRDHTFAEKILSAMRHRFGGHREKPGGG